MTTRTEGNGVNNLDHEIYIPRKEPFLCEKGVGEVLYENMKQRSDNIAQIDALTGKEESYAQLLSRSIRTAQNMQYKGIQPGDVVSLLSYNNMDYCCTILATFFTGTYNSPMEPTSPLIDLTHCLKLTSSKIVFCEEELETTAEDAIQCAEITTEIVVFGKTDRNTPFSDFLIPREPEDTFQIYKVSDVQSVACMHFSSGTTGLPKAVCITHYGLLFVSQARSSKSVKTRSMTVTSPFRISNMNGMVSGFISGNTRVVMKNFDEKLIMKYVHDYQINVVMITPVNGAALIENPQYFQDYDLSCLRVLGTGGSPTSPQQFLEYSRLFPKSVAVGGYGMTETSGIILSPCWQTAKEFEASKKTCIGTPVPGFRYKVVDTETEEAVGPNKEGELRLKFEGIMHSYYKNPEADKNAFDNEGYLKTGDILYYNEDFKFYYIPPLIIENILIEHPNVKQVVVFGVPDKLHGELPTAAIVLNDSDIHDAQEVKNFVEERLPERYQLHGGVYVLEKIPTTSTGKIQRRKLTEMVVKLKNAE